MVANLTLLQRQRQSEPGFIEYIIIDKNAAEKFTISENGLLHTKVRGFFTNLNAANIIQLNTVAAALNLINSDALLQVPLDREERDEYDVLIAMGRRGVQRGKPILEVN